VIGRIIFTTDMADFKEQRFCIKFCFNILKKVLQKPTECYRKPSEIMPWAKANIVMVKTLQGRTNAYRPRSAFWTTVDKYNSGKH